jgi:hypothetical protein
VSNIKERWKVSLSGEAVMLGIAIAALIVISFTGSYTHIVDLAQKHSQHGIEARATAAVVDILCYVFAAERQRDKRIGRKKKWGIVTFPTFGLIVGVAASLAMNLALAGTGPWGYIIAAIPCAALLLVITLLERRTTHSPKIAVPVPGTGAGTATTEAVPVPASTRVPARVPTTPVPGTPVPATVPVPGTAEVPSRYPVDEPRPAPVLPSPLPPAPDRDPDGATSFRSESDLEEEALSLLAAHKEATGKRMNTKDLAVALGVRYKRALVIRSEIQDREGVA